jgi:peptidoglycan/LPS O-acetylase OafA/YrhL
MKSIKASNRVLLPISAGVTVASLVMTHVAYEIIESNKLVCAIGFVAYFAIIACAVAYSSMGLPSPRPLQALGDASFSFYLIHYFVISLAERFLHIDSFSARNILLMIAAVILSWGISYISYYIIEKRLCGWLVKQTNRVLRC